MATVNIGVGIITNIIPVWSPPNTWGRPFCDVGIERVSETTVLFASRASSATSPSSANRPPRQARDTRHTCATQGGDPSKFSGSDASPTKKIVVKEKVVTFPHS